MKQFKFLALNIESMDNLQIHLNIFGEQGWHLGGISDWHNVLFLQRELESKHEVANAPCEQVLKEVREILKTKENFSVVQRAKEVMKEISNPKENNDELKTILNAINNSRLDIIDEVRCASTKSKL